MELPPPAGYEKECRFTWFHFSDVEVSVHIVLIMIMDEYNFPRNVNRL